jgi:hypothetical protein
MNKQLSHLRLKKVSELLKLRLGVYRWCKNGEIKYGRNLIDFVFHPRRTNLLEFFTTTSSELESTIDNEYSKYILGTYNILDQGADFKFNTIRNIFKDMFKTRGYMVNHYSNKLSLPMLKQLKKEFVDRDILNVIPARNSIIVTLREFEDSIYSYVKREYNLVRAGPYNIRSPLVA